MDFSKASIIKESDLPRSNDRIDYTPLFKKIATLAENDILTFPIDKDHHVQNVKLAVRKEFTHNHYHVFQRTIDGKLHCCIRCQK